MSVGELRRRESRGRAQEAVRPGLRLAAVVLAVAAALVVGWLALSNSGAFRIEQVKVEGVSHLSADEVSGLAAVPANATLLNVDASGVSARLRGSAWVKDAKVRRVFPNTLEIDVTERKMAAVVSVPSSKDQATQDWALSDDEVWIAQVPEQGSSDAAGVPQQVYDDAASVLRITDVPYGVSPVAGAKESDASIGNALDIVTGMTTSLAGRVTSVSASSANNAVVSLDDGVQIAFGTSEDLREKERVCEQILAAHPGQVSYINIRSVSRPTWRGITS